MSFLTIIKNACRPTNSKLLLNYDCSRVKYFLKINNTPNTQTRSFFQFFRKPNIQQLKIKDNVPDEYNLIYRSTMEKYLLYAQIVTAISAFGAVVIMVANIDRSINTQGLEPQQYNEKKEGLFRTNIVRPVDNEVTVYFTVLMGIIVTLQFIIGKTPVRIYNYPRMQDYIFIFNRSIPFKTKRVTCKSGEVIHTPENSFMPWKETHYEIKEKQEIILLEENFRRPADLYIMMGVQRDNSVNS